MAPGVPFALLAGVQLLSVAAALGLAGAACFPQLRRRTSPIFVLGALLLALADALLGVKYGSGASTSLAMLHAAGLVLMAIGLATGVLVPPERWSAPALALEPAAVGAVVVPLAAEPSGAVAMAVGAGLAAIASLRGRRSDATGAWLLAAAFGCLTVAGALAGAARTSYAAAVALLALRGAWALLVFVYIARLARASVLAKVVVAILGGVLAMAVGAVAVGSVVAGVVTQQQQDQAQAIARAQSENLDTLSASAGSFAAIVARVCPTNPEGCSNLLSLFGALPDDFAALVPARARHKVQVFNSGTQSKPLSTSGALALRSEPAVRAVLDAKPETVDGATTLAVIDGDLVAFGVYPIRAPGQSPNTPPAGGAAVYAGRIGEKYAKQQRTATTYDLSVLVDGKSAASSLSPAGARVVAEEGQDIGATSGALIDQPGAVLVRTAIGDRPTAAFQELFTPDGKPVAVLAVSQNAATALRAQKRAFTELFLVALGVMLATAIVALLIGRRIVDPVRRLTVVATQVRRGDLTAKSDVTSRDEVGTLARAFDAMTASVATLTDDLRAAAAEETALRARLETVLASMSDGVVATDATGTVTSINRTACVIAGIETAEALGRPVSEVLPVTGADGEPLVVATAMRAPVEGLVARAEGAPVPVLVDTAPLEEADGSAGGFVVVVRDQTRDREVERMKTEFLSNVSHELRTPLTPIRGYAELLRRRPDLPRQQTESYVDTILDSSIRMTRVVDLLVDVAAIEAGRVRAEPRSVPVGSFVDQRLEVWRARYPERAGDFRRRVSRGVPPVLIDPEWVGKALDEFADNAMKYTPAGTTVVLGVAPGKEGRVELSVRDAGPGIDPAAMAGLFGDFIQADGSETRSVGGLGLGLSFVRRLAEALDLGVEVRSDPGKGSEFVLDVPVAPTQDVAPRRRAARGGRSAARRPAKRPSTARRRRPPADPPEPA